MLILVLLFSRVSNSRTDKQTTRENAKRQASTVYPLFPETEIYVNETRIPWDTSLKNWWWWECEFVLKRKASVKFSWCVIYKVWKLDLLTVWVKDREIWDGSFSKQYYDQGKGNESERKPPIWPISNDLIQRGCAAGNKFSCSNQLKICFSGATRARKTKWPFSIEKRFFTHKKHLAG